MARHTIKFALKAAALAVMAGCTQLEVTPGNDMAATEAATEPAKAATTAQTIPVAAKAQAEAPAPLMYASHAPTPAAPPATPAQKPVYHDAGEECGPGAQRANKLFIKDGPKKRETMRINVTGYGAPPKAFYPEPQRRLMAMRAAKVDAYRSLAERVNGLRIWGGTTIGDMVVERDRYRVFLDSYVRGAEVMVVNPLEDGTYETIVELTIGQDFLKTVLDERAQPVNDPCAGHYQQSSNGSQAVMQPPRGQPMESMAQTMPMEPPARPMMAPTGQASDGGQPAQSSGFYYADEI